MVNNPLETTEKSSRVTQERENKRYGDIERKIGLVKGLWQAVQKMQIPSVGDNEEQISNENEGLKDVFNHLLDQVPEAKKKYLRHQKLETLIDGEVQSSELDEEYYHLSVDPDTEFSLLIGGLVESVNDKRQGIRNVLKKIGKDKAGTNNFDAYVDELKGASEEFRGRIKKVVVSNLSFTLVVEKSAMDDYWMKRGEKNGAPAFHSPGSIINVLEESLGQEEGLEEKATKHEDFHSFFDGLKQYYSSPSDIYFAANLYNLSVLAQEEETDESHKKIISKDIGHDRRNLWQSMKSVSAEILVNEYLAGVVGENKRSFRHGIAVWVQNMQNNYPIDNIFPDADSVVREFFIFLSNQYIQESLDWAVQTLKDRAPEKLMDLDIAIAILSPYRMRFIKGLVERWVGAQI